MTDRIFPGVAVDIAESTAGIGMIAVDDTVTYSTDVTCLSWVGGKVPSYGEWKAGHQEVGLYCIYRES